MSSNDNDPQVDASQAPETLTVALWATNLARPLNGIEAWAQMVDMKMGEARARGADLLVMPEYCAEQWLSFAPDLPATGEIAWMADQAPQALDAIGGLARKHGMALLAGTMPVHAETPEPGRPPYLNRAHLFLPDGRMIKQDKLVLTPGERNPQAWDLSTGNQLAITNWRGLRVATAICLDVEMPALIAKLGPEELDLVMVPSMTEKLSGHSRVFGCAKARAVELQAAVLAVGSIGAGETRKGRETTTGAAAVYLPCEEPLGMTGVAGWLPPRDFDDGPGPMLVAEVPVAAIRALRNGAAEVWPGAWSAEHVEIVGDSNA
ncbi:MAG: nitrilase-related carbon-nitrogen hydrolase [Rhodovibrionaceae bacterium]|nr:nitrilase-related carbon-nitrogen hydrolase [Rhodovibrionaceae bacterium]